MKEVAPVCQLVGVDDCLHLCVAAVCCVKLCVCVVRMVAVTRSRLFSTGPQPSWPSHFSPLISSSRSPLLDDYLSARVTHISPYMRMCRWNKRTHTPTGMSENLSARSRFYCFFLECAPAHACTQTHTLADQVSLDVVSAHGDSGPAKCHSILKGVALQGCQVRHNELSARRLPLLYRCQFSSGSCWRLIPPETLIKFAVLLNYSDLLLFVPLGSSPSRWAGAWVLKTESGSGPLPTPSWRTSTNATAGNRHRFALPRQPLI